MPRVQREAVDRRTDKEKVHIDPNELDVEWCRIADDIYEAAEKVTDVEAVILIRETKKTRITNEMDLKIRQEPQAFGLETVTEPAVKAALARDKSIQKAEARLHDARISLMRAKNLVTGLLEKRRGLEHLVTLQGQNYFATPRDKTGIGGDMRRKNIDDKISTKLQKKGK